MARLLRAAGALAVLMTAACGQRGPLYLPEEAQTEVRQSAPAPQPQQDKTQQDKTQPETTTPQTSTQQGTTTPQTTPQQGTPQPASEPSQGTPADAEDARAKERRKSEQPSDEKPR